MMGIVMKIYLAIPYWVLVPIKKCKEMLPNYDKD